MRAIEMHDDCGCTCITRDCRCVGTHERAGEDVRARGCWPQLQLVHSTHFTHALTLLQLQQQLDGEGKLMRCMPFFTRDSAASRFDVIKVLQHTPAAAGAQVVVCGPAGFMEAARCSA